MKTEKIQVVHVGVSGFPYAINASINRCNALYTIINKIGFRVFVINNRAVDKSLFKGRIDNSGSYNGIDFEFTPSNLVKPTSFIKRRINNFSGRMNELRLIHKKSIKDNIDLMIFYPTGKFTELLYYRFFSKIYKYPLIVHYVEYRSAFKSRENFLVKYNDKLFDKYLTFLSDGVIPISNFLVDKLRERSDIDYIKIPPLVDFSLFNSTKMMSEKYFLYVGSVGYYDVIELIIQSFEQIKNDDFKLYLVLSGNINSISDRISKSIKKKTIRVFSNLEYEELIDLYCNAKALLIPLRDNIQDKARFPQKISEYLASKKPVITTGFGEILFYFKDKENAIIAKKDNKEEFSKAMKFVIDNPKKATNIGLKGYITGLKYFDKKNYSYQINNFLINVLNKSKD